MHELNQFGARSMFDSEPVEQPHIAFVLLVLATIVVSVLLAIATQADPSMLSHPSIAAVLPEEILSWL